MLGDRHEPEAENLRNRGIDIPEIQARPTVRFREVNYRL